MNQTPGNWNWHDAFGRVNGKGEPIGIGRGITGDEPKLGSCSRFSYAVSDGQGFVVAHCTNALVTMSSDRSEANARLVASAPEMLAALEDASDLTKLARQYFPKSIRNSHKFQLENTCATIGTAIFKAAGGSAA